MTKRCVKAISAVMVVILVTELAGGAVAVALVREPRYGDLRCTSPRWRGPHFAEGAAASLGTEPDTLRERMREGQLLRDMAAEQGKALRDLTNELMDAYDMALAEEVDQVYFTESGATCRLQRFQQRIESCLAGVSWDRSPWIQTGSEAIAKSLGDAGEAAVRTSP